LKELHKRILVAFFGIPLIIGIIYFGSLIFTLGIILISSFTIWEFYSIVEKKNAKPNKLWGSFFNILFILITYLGFYSIHFNQILILAIIIFIIGALSLQIFSTNHNAIMNISATIGGVAYITLFFICLLLVREFNFFFDSILNIEPMSLVYAFIISIWICDTFAYFLGIKFGKHKLIPHISPKKSWEGAVAGFLGAILSMLFFEYVFLNIGILNSLFIGIIVGIGGQIGDLAESQLKRDAGIKDSSTILPGHGGFLDRFDSILFVSPLVLVYLLLLNFFF